VREATASGGGLDARSIEHSEDDAPFHPCHNFFTVLCVVASERRGTVNQMRKPIPFPSHRHKAVTTYALRQFEGVPYEVERVRCKDCRETLEERPVRRAAA
jgi:hypothetical protein